MVRDTTLAPVELVKRSSFFPDPGKRRTTVKIKQVDAFTDSPLTGNPAGVVVKADGLTDQQMQLVAQEMAVSETAFVLAPTTPAADLRIRWFTPRTEVPLCGHATIASFHALAEDCMYRMADPGIYHFKLECKSGILPVTVEKNAQRTKVLLGLSAPQFVRAGQHKLDMLRILKISLDEIENRMPLVIAANDLFVPIRRLHTIFSMKPNFAAMSQFLANRSLLGLCVFTTETVDRVSTFHSRFFAPTIGIDEDPVTGSANGPLGAYLLEQGKVEATGDSVTLIGEQGDVIGRRGRVSVQMRVEGRRAISLYIGGTAVTVLDSEMLLAQD
jgi:trans-2,3-dihydro-3-hydroxyanthranilate isomerase